MLLSLLLLGLLSLLILLLLLVVVVLVLGLLILLVLLVVLLLILMKVVKPSSPMTLDQVIQSSTQNGSLAVRGRGHVVIVVVQAIIDLLVVGHIGSGLLGAEGELRVEQLIGRLSPIKERKIGEAGFNMLVWAVVSIVKRGRMGERGSRLGSIRHVQVLSWSRFNVRKALAINVDRERMLHGIVHVLVAIVSGGGGGGGGCKVSVGNMANVTVVVEDRLLGLDVLRVGIIAGLLCPGEEIWGDASKDELPSGI